MQDFQFPVRSERDIDDLKEERCRYGFANFTILEYWLVSKDIYTRREYMDAGGTEARLDQINRHIKACRTCGEIYAKQDLAAAEPVGSVQ